MNWGDIIITLVLQFGNWSINVKLVILSVQFEILTVLFNEFLK